MSNGSHDDDMIGSGSNCIGTLRISNVDADIDRALNGNDHGNNSKKHPYKNNNGRNLHNDHKNNGDRHHHNDHLDWDSAKLFELNEDISLGEVTVHDSISTIA